MKHLLVFSFLLMLLLSINADTFAQDAGGNVFVMQRIEAAFPADGSRAEFDSLTSLYNANVWDKNPLVISHKTIRHWWGNNNRDVIEITEVSSWENILKANEKNAELFEAFWTTKEDRDSFNKAYDKYFTGEHSDEIYQEVKFDQSLSSN